MQSLFFPLPNPTTNAVVATSSPRWVRNNPCRSMTRGSALETDSETLQTRFGRKGVTFTGIGGSTVVRIELENGTAANVMLPSGLVTSFKPQMWHGATMELLHTSVSQPQNKSGAAVIQGGLSLALACREIGGVGASWSPGSWNLHRLSGNHRESFQVELMSTIEQGDVSMKQTLTLQRDALDSQIVVSNATTLPIHLLGSTVCHLAVSTPDAAYAVGLLGSDYFDRPPLGGSFSIIPPEPSPKKLWSLDKLFSRDGTPGVEGGLEGQEDDNYKHLTKKISRFYTSAPRSFTIIDRGRRNSVTLRREGFKELYVFSPGSEHEWYGKYSYICIGHAAQLEPVILNAQSQWSGGVQLLNPNSKE